MIFRGSAESPLGAILLAGDEEALTGLWFRGQRYEGAGLPRNAETREELPTFQTARRWLSAYFAGRPLPQPPPLRPAGTEFQQAVWQQLLTIPRGERRSYGAIAAALEGELGRRTSPRAVGSAVGRNPISLLIPCHRVIGGDGSLTGYAGGLERKRALLQMEENDME